MLHLYKLISTFYRDHPEKPRATSSLIDSAPPMVRPTAKLKAEASSKQKRGRPAKDSNASKCDKKTWTGFLSRFLTLFRKQAKDSHSYVILLRSAPPRSLILFDLPTLWFSPTFRFFLLGIGQEDFSTNHRDFSVFLHQSPRGLEVFHR